jgi:hypothetical protein
MEVAELLGWLTNGLDETEAAVVRKAVERDAVKANIATVKAQKEYEALATQAGEVQQLKEELDAVDPQGNPRGFRAWYKKHGDAVVKQSAAIKAFEDKHGAGMFEKLAAGEFKLPSENITPGVGMTADDVQKLIDAKLKAGSPATPDDIQKLIDKRFQETYAPSTANTVVTAGHILQKHMLAGRKNPIDFNALAKLAGDKFAGNMEQAYDDWDKPERDKLDSAARKAEIDAAVAAAKTAWDDERITQQGKEKFPGGADLTPGNLAHRSDADKFNANDFKLDLAKEWSTAGEKVN